MSIGLGGHLPGRAGHVLAIEAPLTALAGDPFELLSAIVGLGSLSAALFGAARVGPARSGALALDSAGLAVVAYTAALVLDGALLVARWPSAVVLAQLARRTGDRWCCRSRRGCYLAAAVLHALALEAPPEALVYGADSLVAAAVALGACGLAALACAHLRLGDRTCQLGLWFGGAITLLYLASVAIVTVFQPGGAETTLLDLPIRQQGQVLVSALWGVVGLLAVLAGLRNDMRELRIGALALLLAAVGEGVPVRPRDARVGVPGGVVPGARRAAAGGVVRVPATAARRRCRTCARCRARCTRRACIDHRNRRRRNEDRTDRTHVHGDQGEGVRAARPGRESG